jgi:hypothetical protein
MRISMAGHCPFAKKEKKKKNKKKWNAREGLRGRRSWSLMR